MKVRIGDNWHNSDDVPICIQVSKREQFLIASLDRETAPNGRIAVFPKDWTAEQAREWMNSTK